MENEWNVYAYFRFIHHLEILKDSCVLSQLLSPFRRIDALYQKNRQLFEAFGHTLW